MHYIKCTYDSRQTRIHGSVFDFCEIYQIKYSRAGEKIWRFVYIKPIIRKTLNKLILWMLYTIKYRCIFTNYHIKDPNLKIEIFANAIFYNIIFYSIRENQKLSQNFSILEIFNYAILLMVNICLLDFNKHFQTW